jgi:NAD(P)H-hydrate epimerase
MKLVTVAQMRDIEKEADANGLLYAEMMENAGRGLAEIVNEISLDDEWEDVLGLVGPGNNGGDTLVALTHLAEEGWHARAYVVKRKKKDELVARLLEAGGEVTFAESDKDFSALGMCFESAMFYWMVCWAQDKTSAQDEICVPEQCLLSWGIWKSTASSRWLPSGVDCETGNAAIECILRINRLVAEVVGLNCPPEFVGDRL